MQSIVGVPDSVEDSIDSSQIAQAGGLPSGIEHVRRRTSHSSRTLARHMKDCRLVLSCALMNDDAFGMPGHFSLLPRSRLQPRARVVGGIAGRIELETTEGKLGRLGIEIAVSQGAFARETVVKG